MNKIIEEKPSKSKVLKGRSNTAQSATQDDTSVTEPVGTHEVQPEGTAGEGQDSSAAAAAPRLSDVYPNWPVLEKGAVFIYGNLFKPELQVFSYR